MMKIEQLKLSGLRGIKNTINLDLDNKSLLLFGDNGSGKSSITDALEWLYRDKIDHLSIEEIDRKGGISALRNIFLTEAEKSFIELKFTDNQLSCRKELFNNNGNEDFQNYLDVSKKENLFLRSKDLARFVLSTKKEKLDELSNIIGFSKVTDVRKVLLQCVNKLNKEIKNKNFEEQISKNNSLIVELLNRTVTSDQHLFDAIHNLILPLGIDKTPNLLIEIEKIIDLIQQPGDAHIVELLFFYNDLNSFILNLPSKLDEIEKRYKSCYALWNEIIGNSEIVNELLMEKLLSVGVKVLEKNVLEDEKCPLCLQKKNKIELLEEIGRRITDLKRAKEKKTVLDENIESLVNLLSGNIAKIQDILKNKFLNEEENPELKVKLEKLGSTLNKYKNEFKKDLIQRDLIELPENMGCDRELLNQIMNFTKQKKDGLERRKQDDKKFDIHKKIVMSKRAYLEIKTLEKEREVFATQAETLQLIYEEFVKRQKEELEFFCNIFSENINGFYRFMNPGEGVDDIKLIPLIKNDELTGLSIQFEYFRNFISPPQKYLSESHLHSLGLAFFLASVKAFNKQNKFFVLDDVVSSYDANHRNRFINLLLEKFSDYQIIVFTHEKNWFTHFSDMVKGRDWQVKTIKWSEEEGSYIEESLQTLKEKIELKIRQNEEDGLGNQIRKYMEFILKKIAYNLEVKVRFLYNETNEHRMSNELLRALKSTLKKSNAELADKKVFDRLSNSIIIGNTDSHDHRYRLSMGDIKAFWQDVLELENIVFCENCQKFVSMKYYDTVNKTVRCACTNNGKSYKWKK